MGIQYAGGTIVNTTFVSDGTRRQLVDQLAGALATAGWSYVSGSGTADVLMQSATTPQGCSIRFRLYDAAGATNCARFYMMHSNGTASNPGYVLPVNGSTFRIVANKYQWFLFLSGDANKSAPRSSAMGGTIWIPSYIASTLYDLELGWLAFAGETDTSVTGRSTFRAYAGFNYGATLFNTWMVNHSNGGIPVPGLAAPMTGSNSNNSYKWEYDAVGNYDALIAWSSTSAYNGEHKIKGCMWDAVCHSRAIGGEVTFSLDGHTFMAITANNAMAASNAPTTLCIRVS